MSKKLVVVTGGTKGIGKAIIDAFVRGEMFDFVTCSRNEKDLMAVKNEWEQTYPNVKVHVFKADLSLKGDCEAFVQFVNSHKQEVEILVNNAGIFFPGSVHNEPEGSLEKMIETNLYSAYRITRAFIGSMKERKRGHIFNMCSTASIIPYVNGGSYCIAKFALLGMTKVLREEMKENGVRVTAILPGATLTASWEGADIPPTRFMKPEDVASAVLNAYTMSKNAVVEEILIRPQLGDI